MNMNVRNRSIDRTVIERGLIRTISRKEGNKVVYCGCRMCMSSAALVNIEKWDEG